MSHPVLSAIFFYFQISSNQTEILDCNRDKYNIAKLQRNHNCIKRDVFVDSLGAIRKHIINLHSNLDITQEMDKLFIIKYIRSNCL